MNNISQVTKRDILDELKLLHIPICGNMDEIEFLQRIYDLGSIASTDPRYSNARDDIVKHRVANSDWDDYWVFHDNRFGLVGGCDEQYLSFLCEMLHPVVRSNYDETERLVQMFNRYLQKDSWMIVPSTAISGRHIYTGRRVSSAKQHHIGRVVELSRSLDGASYLAQQIIRLEASEENDPELAIGTAKELVETICKSILSEMAVTPADPSDFSKLVKETLKCLNLVPEEIPETAKGAENIRVIINSLTGICGRLSELRNLYGTGHGKGSRMKGLQPRHAGLAVGCAVTIANFLYQTYQEKYKKSLTIVT